LTGVCPVPEIEAMVCCHEVAAYYKEAAVLRSKTPAKDKDAEGRLEE
jgi:hypothetical protein